MEFVEVNEYRRFPHNILVTAIKRQRDSVSERVENGNREGLAFDVLSGIVLAAFAFEATLNFVGHNRFGEAWPERARVTEKAKLLFRELELDYDQGARPFQTMVKLLRIRNELAHAKPDIGTSERRMGSMEPSDLFEHLKLPFLKEVTPDFFFRAIEDFEFISDKLRNAAGIRPWDETSRVAGSITRVR